ncbi:MAG: crossover junction endodeoxyribonuclease RuvC [Elusimicrobiota bacterium]
MKDISRVLGIDPGLERTGWAIAEKKENSKTALIASGLIETSSTLSLQERLDKIYCEIKTLAEKYSPSQAAVEEIYFSKKAVSQRSTTYARGVIILALHRAKIPLSEYNPRTVKSFVSGNGNADKNQMTKAVSLIFSLKEPLTPDDVSDAAAIAFVHLRNSGFAALIEKGKKG